MSFCDIWVAKLKLNREGLMASENKLPANFPEA